MFATSALRRLLIAAGLLGLIAGSWHIHSRQLDQRLYHSSRLQAAAERSGDSLFDYRVELEAKPIVGIDHNLSGLSWDFDRNALWAVTNDPTVLFALDRDGNVQRRIELVGFHDVEAVSYLGGDRLAVAEERQGTIVFFMLPKEEGGAVQRANAPTWRLSAIGGEENKGIEGLDYDRRNDRLLLVKERDPRRLLALEGVTAALANGTAPSVVPLSAHLDDDVFARDLSSVAADPQSGELLLLSDESRVVMALSGEGDLTSFSSLLRRSAGLERPVPQAEGLAVGDDGDMYIASEPNLFYRFALEAEAPNSAATSGAASLPDEGF